MTRGVIALTALVACCPAAAHAEGDVAMQAVGPPSYFTFDARPGGHAGGQVLLTNLTDRPQTVRLAPADVGVAGTGGLSYGVGRPREAGRWVHPAAATVRLAAGQRRVVDFTVTVPKRSSGGDHYASLTAATAPRRAVAHAGRSRINLRFLTRMAIAVRVRVPGPRRPRLQVGSATVRLRGLPALVVPIANPGTGLLPGVKVALAVRHAGRRLFTIRQDLGSFVPHGRLALENRWPVRLVYGTYRLDGSITGAGRTIAIHQRMRIAAPTGHNVSAVGVDAELRSHPWLSWAPIVAATLAALSVGAAGGALVRIRLR